MMEKRPLIILDHSKFRVQSYKEYFKLKNIDVFDIPNIKDNLFIVDDMAPSFILIDFESFIDQNETVDIFEKLKLRPTIIFIKEPSDKFNSLPDNCTTRDYPVDLESLSNLITIPHQ